LLSDKTFYVKNGDVAAQLCCAISIMILLATILKINTSKRN